MSSEPLLSTIIPFAGSGVVGCDQEIRVISDRNRYLVCH
jgi:hypothetical protein